MSNVLPIEIISDIRKLRESGVGIRAISRELGISKNTVSRYIDSKDGILCNCGQPVGHKGWCKFRYSASIKRQAFHASRRGIKIDIPTVVSKSRQKEDVAQKRVWLGLEEFIGRRLPRDEWYGAIGEVQAATKTVLPEIRDDVRQEMIAAALEGRLDRRDIYKAVPTFISYFLRGMVWNSPLMLSMDEFVLAAYEAATAAKYLSE